MNLGKSHVGEDERRKIGDGWLDRPEGVYFLPAASGRSSASKYLEKRGMGVDARNAMCGRFVLR